MDGQRVYTANANSNAKAWSLPGGSSTISGVWRGLSGAAISNREVFCGSGYSTFGFGTRNNVFYAFELP